MKAQHAAATFPQPRAAKVPEITAWFWIIKILTTAGGEAVSDYLALHNHLIGGALEAIFFMVALVVQFRVRRYLAWAYWTLAFAIATAGTGVSDTMHLTFSMPYTVTTGLWSVALAAIFVVWFVSERTLSIHSIVTRRREIYYWMTIFATFALGTAWGDLTATTLHLGYLASGIAFGVVILVPAVGWRYLRFNTIGSFWFAYIITRPLGASFADYFSKPHSVSGADLGAAPVAIVLTLAVVVAVAYVARTRPDIQSASAARDW